MMLIAGAIAGLMVVGGTTMTIARKTTAKKTAVKKAPATKAVHKPGTKAGKRPARVTDRISGKTVTDPRPANHYPQIERVRAAHLAGDTFPEGTCLEQFRTVVLQLDHGVYPDAETAWKHAEHKVVEHDPTKWPRGAAGFLGPGSHGHGHVVEVTGEGNCWTPGGPDNAHQWYHTEIMDVATRWGMQPYGYTLEVDGVDVGPVHGHR